MVNAFIILKSILGILGSVGLFYLVGRGFNFLLNKKKVYWGWMPTYFYLVCGMLLCVSAYALFKTGGATIMAIIPVLLFFLAKGVNNKFTFEVINDYQRKWPPFLFLVGSIVVAYLYYLQAFSVNGDQIKYIWGDQEYYARVAENINLLGIENMRVEYLFPDRFTVEPYHYGDLWTIALCYSLAGIMPVLASVLVAAPILMATAALGIASVVHHFFLQGKRNYAIYLLMFIGLLGGFGVLFPSFIFPGSVDVYARSMSHYTKLLWGATMVPLIFALVLNKKDELIIFLVFIIGIGYINVLPSVVMGSFLWLSYISIKRKVFLNNLGKMLAMTIAMAGFMYLLYAFYPSLSATKRPLSGKAVFSIASIIANLKTSINIFLGGIFQFFVYLPPLILLFVYFVIEKVKFRSLPIFNLLLYALIVMLSALFIWAALFSTTVDSIQFFYNVFVVFAGLLSAIIYLYVMSHSSKAILKISALILFVIAVIANLKYDINVNVVSKKERNELFTFVDSSPNKTFAYYKPLEAYTSDFFASGTVVAVPYSILDYKVNRYENISLNLPFIQLSEEAKTRNYQLSNIQWAPINYFKNKGNNPDLSENELMSQFMHDYKVVFLSMPIATNIPAVLEAYVLDSVYTPSLGWKIYKCGY